MKTNNLIKLKDRYGDLKVSDILKQIGRDFLCPKCKGLGVEKRVKPGEFGYTEDHFYTIECDICEGHGYTKKELKPITKTEIIGYE